MTEVVEIAQTPSNDDVVGLLRGLLTKAESGELTGIAVATLQTGREIGHAYAGVFHDDVYAMLGALVSLQRRVCEEKDA